MLLFDWFGCCSAHLIKARANSLWLSGCVIIWCCFWPMSSFGAHLIKAQINTHSTSSHQQHPRHTVHQQQQQQTEQCSKEHQRGMIGPNYKWADVWNILRKQGWTYKAGSRNVGWCCIPPSGKAQKKIIALRLRAKIILLMERSRPMPWSNMVGEEMLLNLLCPKILTLVEAPL